MKAGRTNTKIFYGYVISIAAFFIFMVAFGLHSAFGVFFKPVMNDFGWTRTMTSGAFSLAVVMQGLAGIFMGSLNDRLGPRFVLSLCGLLFGLGFLLMSQISSIWQLYLFYGIILGSGLSGIWVPLMSTVARWFTARRGLISGLTLAGLGVGGMIAPPLATALIRVFDWRFTYFALGMGGLIIIVAAAQFLKKDPSRIGEKPYGYVEIHEKQKTPSVIDFTLKQAVGTRQFWIFSVALFCSGFGITGLMVHLVPHATDIGFSAGTAGAQAAVLAAFASIGRIGFGSGVDRIGSRRVFIIAFILLAAAMLILVPSRQPWQLFLAVSIFGLAQGGLGVAESPLVAELFGLSSHGLIYGVFLVGWTLGASVGPLFAGYVFDATGSYPGAFLVTAGFGIAGAVMMVLLKPIKKLQA